LKVTAPLYQRAFCSLIKTLGTFMMHNVAQPVNGNRPLTAMACMALLFVSIAACKKDNEKGIAEKLMNKWSLVQILDTVYTSGASPVAAKYDGKTEEYFDFKKNGRLLRFINNKYDTASYTFSEANLKLNVEALHYNILILTDNTMILYEPHYTVSTGAYTAYKITLKR
jgi:hypothetical protein